MNIIGNIVSIAGYDWKAENANCFAQSVGFIIHAVNHKLKRKPMNKKQKKTKRKHRKAIQRAKAKRKVLLQGKKEGKPQA